MLAPFKILNGSFKQKSLQRIFKLMEIKNQKRPHTTFLTPFLVTAIIGNLCLTGTGFSQEPSNLPPVLNNKITATCDEESLGYLKNGFTCLSYDPFNALEFFQKAAVARHGLLWNETDFLICFGKIIACDQLGMLDESEHMFHVMCREIADEETGPDYDGEPEISIEKRQRTLAFLHMQANLSRSYQMRLALNALIENLDSDADQLFVLAEPLNAESDNEPYSLRYWLADKPEVQNCRLFWDRMEHILKKTVRIVEKILDAYILTKKD
jgi:hypothetical protein